MYIFTTCTKILLYMFSHSLLLSHTHLQAPFSFFFINFASHKENHNAIRMLLILERNQETSQSISIIFIIPVYFFLLFLTIHNYNTVSPHGSLRVYHSINTKIFNSEPYRRAFWFLLL